MDKRNLFSLPSDMNQGERNGFSKLADEVNVASRCIAFGEEKGFPILIDGDVDNEDGMTKKSTIFRVTKTSPGWISANGRGCISRQSEKVLATP